MSQRAKQILFVFLDTGGGHCSAASAVAQALCDRYGEEAQVDLVDAMTGYLPWPFSELNSLYNQLVRLNGWPWALTYHLSNGPRRVALLKEAWWPLVRESLLRLLREHPADVVVCCHPLLKDPVLRAQDEVGSKAPLVTLVTDLIAGHAFWFVPGDARCLVPTERARRRALASGLSEKRIQVTGLPVGPCFVASAEEPRSAFRHRLGLKADLPLVLLTSGADGMGAFHSLCRAIVESGVEAQLAMIAGRNEDLRAQLASETWPLPVEVKGFVRNMYEWMGAADLLVTKAGPSTISEALVMGLPMVLSDALPGQELPNVDYVVQSGAGVWAPDPGRAAGAVRGLLTSDDSSLAQMSARARALSQPEAAWRVAEIAWACANGELA